jgi:hypothetical protein
MENFMKDSGLKNVTGLDTNSVPEPAQMKATPLPEMPHTEFLNAFSNLYTTVLSKKLRKLKSELKDQYVFTIEPLKTTKNPKVMERAIIIKSKADNKLGKISIIKFLEKKEISIQGIPLSSNPSQLYNKMALIPFMGKLEEFDSKKFEGYIFHLLDYCFQ